MQNVTIKTIACGLSHSGCVTGEGEVFVWGLTGEVQGKPNLETLLEKCLFKRPTQVSFKHCLERESSQSQLGSGSARRKSSANEDGSTIASAEIEDLKMGEYLTVALSTRGYVYTWGMNDKGQLGIGQEVPQTFEPVAVSSSKSTLSKAVQRI
jgi:alpha-tubulin suppressor-like RCC1 family protein